MRAVSLVDHGFEDLEFWYPVLRLREASLTVDIAAAKIKEEYVGKYGVPVESTISFGELDVQKYDIVLVPGGWAPDKLRRYPQVLDFVYNMNANNKIIGQICHAGWVTISAGILKGRKVTSTPGIKDDMINAGAEWLDEEVVIDGNLVSSRRPADLPIYMHTILQLLPK